MREPLDGSCDQADRQQLIANHCMVVQEWELGLIKDQQGAGDYKYKLFFWKAQHREDVVVLRGKG
jgi:hypothetical protein